MDLKLAYIRLNEAIEKLSLNGQPSELYEPVKYFLQLGGKRMRPLLSLIGCHLFDNDYEKALKPAIAIELFHNFTLIHDDIMDNAPLRRGMPTVHEKWNRNIALLAGDITLIFAYELLSHAPTKVKDELYLRFNLTARQVCEGQQFDMNFENQAAVTLEQYIEMITLKTAVLLAYSMYQGARIGGASHQDAENLYQCALLMGISFQIKDDWLDVYGNSQKVGKRVGGDIIANKKTYLLISALEQANTHQKATLHQLLTDRCIAGDDKVSAVMDIYKQLNIEQQTLQAIEKYFNQAVDLLNKIQASESKKQYLLNYFTELLNREN